MFQVIMSNIEIAITPCGLFDLAEFGREFDHVTVDTTSHARTIGSRRKTL